MTQSFSGRIFDVVISSGQTATRAISAYEDYADATAVNIMAPATLDAGTYTIEVSFDASTWATLSDANGDIEGPAAGKARQYIEVLAFPYFRIKGPTAAATRTFLASKQWTA